MVVTGKEKYLWVSNILPAEIVEELGLSVAGKKMETNLVRSLYKQKDCDVLSVSRQGYSQSERLGFKLFDDKTYNQINVKNVALLQNKTAEKEVYNFLLKWCKKNIDKSKIVIVINSPLFVCRRLLKLKKKFNLKLISYTVDLPIVSKPKNVKQWLLNRYNKRYFNNGIKCLKGFNGLIGVNSNLKTALKVDIPFYKTLIGYDVASGFLDVKPVTIPLEIGYAGTLIDYNGVIELIDAVSALDNDLFHLHIFGYGPQEEEIKILSRERSNVYFHGRFNNVNISEVLLNIDVLVNPRKVGIEISDYTFPSKIVEYLAMGKVVLSTRFSSMPKEYEQFVFLVGQADSTQLKEAIFDISKHSADSLYKMQKAGQDFVKIEHNYDNITSEIIKFIERC